MKKVIQYCQGSSCETKKKGFQLNLPTKWKNHGADVVQRHFLFVLSVSASHSYECDILHILKIWHKHPLGHEDELILVVTYCTAFEL